MNIGQKKPSEAQQLDIVYEKGRVGRKEDPLCLEALLSAEEPVLQSLTGESF